MAESTSGEDDGAWLSVSFRDKARRIQALRLEVINAAVPPSRSQVTVVALKKEAMPVLFCATLTLFPTSHFTSISCDITLVARPR